MDRLYAGRFSRRDRLEKVRLWRVLCRSFFDRYVPADGSVLDVGAGYCDFINHIAAARRVAVDLNPDTALAAADDVEVYRHPLERLDDVLEPDSIDLAFASNVFEHLRGPDALLRVLAALRVVLRPGGRLMIMQPNARIVGGAFYDFFDHTLPLSEKGMAEALGVTGFEVVECRARFLPYTTKSRLPKWPWLVRLYLALPPARWLFGKQMLVVARKPADGDRPWGPPA
ncbi:class I SAM-dependent methyltransferase [Tautonia sociabilis]|uniref:Class I SAM-dependent methyltransferase n=1 Tax=Tautonia sociabilis TaxID=2080755 RepID=A0A432MC65_9BACT|nr:class I SAM-dependent methyltransferase [Tautonia sociabilis]